MELRSQALNAADIFRGLAWVMVGVGVIAIFSGVWVMVDQGASVGLAYMVGATIWTLAMWAFLTLAAIVAAYVAQKADT
jgi:hypothetical protein